MKIKVIFLGAGGYAKSALDSLDNEAYEFCGFIDGFKPVGSLHLGYPILDNCISRFSERHDYKYFVSIGNNEHRVEKINDLRKHECDFISIVDKTAIVSSGAELGKGVFVGKMAIINNDVRIGHNVIINTKALIEHGCRIADNSNISTNATVNGDVSVGESCFIGSASVINGQLFIGRNSVVGSGAVVTKDVESYLIVAGVPAKIIKEIRR